jgi:hypothetical protein
MPKSIPTLSQQNWGTPLNDHLSQLNDPTTGGINKFDTFSARPTNLTTNDTGKTYLYTQTGNLHQWTGSTWKVLNKSHINVKDYGAVGDGTTDDTFAVQGAVNICNTQGGGNCFFPKGKYSLSAGINVKENVAIIGEGMFNTIFTHTSNDVCFTALDGALFSRVEFRDFSLFGNSGTSAKGIVFGNIGFARLENIIIYSYPNGTGIEASNTRLWTEISQWDNVMVRGTKRCIAFTRTGGTESFSNTRILNMTLVPISGGIGVYVAPTCWLYACTLNIKGNFESTTSADPQVIGIYLDGCKVVDSHFEILFETYYRKDLVLKAVNGAQMTGEGYVKSQIQDSTNTGQTGEGPASYYELDNTSTVSLNSFIGNNVLGLFGHKLYVGNLTSLTNFDINSATKYKIQVFGGGFGSNDIGVATYTVSSRDVLKVTREIHNGSVSHHELKIYKNGVNYDIVLECDAVQYPAMNIRVWKLEQSGYNEMIINKNLYDATGKVNATPAFIDTFATDSQGFVGIGTTFPTSKFQVVGLPEYTDNTTAIAGGLTIGAFYRTGDLLKVVH